MKNIRNCALLLMSLILSSCTLLQPKPEFNEPYSPRQLMVNIQAALQSGVLFDDASYSEESLRKLFGATSIHRIQLSSGDRINIEFDQTKPELYSHYDHGPSGIRMDIARTYSGKVIESVYISISVNGHMPQELGLSYEDLGEIFHNNLEEAGIETPRPEPFNTGHRTAAPAIIYSVKIHSPHLNSTATFHIAGLEKYLYADFEQSRDIEK